MPDRPNILWLYCDELRTDALGCYGNPQVPVQTPHLDRLAEQGTRFTRSYCNTPICVASRTSILTGQYPEQNGVYSNEGAWSNFKHQVTAKTFPEVFADHGYITATFGKSHVPKSLKPWQVENTAGGGMGECDAAWPDNPRKNEGVSGRCGTIPIDVPYEPNKVADNTIRFLQEQHGSNQPWLCRASWLQPHTPVLPPAPWGEMYMHCDVDLGEPDLAKLSKADRTWLEEFHARVGKSKDMRAVLLRYYALTSWVDSQVGAVLSALNALGQSDNTVVVFTADHGCMAGNWGITGKHIFHPYSQKVPLIYRMPGRVEAGAVRKDINESLDLAKTLFGLAGITPSDDHFQGRDLFSEPEPEAVFGTISYGYPCSYLAPNGGAGAFHEGGGWPRRTCARTRDYRFEKTVMIDGHTPEADEVDAFLAVTSDDPIEQVNRIGDPGLQDVATRLSSLIDEHAKGSVELPHEWVDRTLR